VWLIFSGVATEHKPSVLGIHWDPHHRRYRVVTSSSLPNMEPLNAHDHSIRFSVPTHQRSTFNRAMAGLIPAFLGVCRHSRGFKSNAACKARLQGFLIRQKFQNGGTQPTYANACTRGSLIDFTHVPNWENEMGASLSSYLPHPWG
jgi:hypothetical protein